MKQKQVTSLIYALGEIDASFTRFKIIAESLIMQEKESYIKSLIDETDKLIEFLEAWKDLVK